MTDQSAVQRTLDLPALEWWEQHATGWLPARHLPPMLFGQAGPPEPGSVVELRHPEGVLLGTIEVRSVDGSGQVSGSVTIAAASVRYDHLDLRRSAEGLQGAGPHLIAPLSGVPSAGAVDVLVDLAVELDLPVLLLTLGAGMTADDVDGHTVVRAHRVLADAVRSRGVETVHVLVAASADPEDTGRLARRIGGVQIHPRDIRAVSGADVTSRAVDLLLHRAPAAALAAGDTLPAIHDLLSRRVTVGSERGVGVLFTGLSGSGKSTVAGAVMAMLHAQTDRRATLLDGDLVRTHLSSELGFSRAHRDLNVERIGFVAAEVVKHGGIALAAPIAPYAGTRDRVRQMIEAVGEFLLVHVATPLEVCEARDRKGLYAKARRGEIAEFTGISDPYEVPVDADLTIDTTDLDVEDAAAQVLRTLRERQLL